MAQDAELAGHVLGGNFRLVRGVSDGPRKVYEARHDRLSGRFAVKTWPTTTPWDAFKRGAELASTLRHPGVMQVLDFNYEAGGPPFLVLEWVDGRRLSDLIAESGLLPVERVAPLIESAAWALASAHQQGIVHQELRPEDIYVVQASGSMREWVKIAGFGVNASLARVRKPPPSRYRAPEQEAADATAALAGASVEDGDDPQSDQYALAAIAYEMLAGVPPFDEERSSNEPLPIADLAPGVNLAIDAAIRQALAAEPEQRFAGVLEFARALRAGVEGAAPEAVRRMRDARAGGEGRKDAVSPFFNPLQGAAEALRRVATSTARLKTLAGEGGFWPARTSARIGFAGVLLFAAFAGTAFLTRNRPPPPAAAPVVAAAPVEPAPVEPPDAEAEPTPDAEQTAVAAGEGQAPDAAAAPGDQPAEGLAFDPEPIPTTTITAKARPVARTAKAAPKAAAPGAPPMCVMSVGSRPAADVLIDERSIGKRTPVAKYKLPCGDHKLVLRRADLDIYQMEIITLRPGVPFKKVYPLQ
jgi:hypothetical protein